MSRNLDALAYDHDIMPELEATFLTPTTDHGPSSGIGHRNGTSRSSSFTELSEASLSQSVSEEALCDFSGSSSASKRDNE